MGAVPRIGETPQPQTLTVVEVITSIHTLPGQFTLQTARDSCAFPTFSGFS